MKTEHKNMLKDECIDLGFSFLDGIMNFLTDEKRPSRHKNKDDKNTLGPQQTKNRHYQHLEKGLAGSYGKRREKVLVEPSGRGMPDLVGMTKKGSKFVGEIKNQREVAGSTSSWWSFWKKELATKYHQDTKKLSSESRGWLAVIDGQLHKYAKNNHVSRGDLWVEHGEKNTESIRKTLDFLKSEGRLKSFNMRKEKNGHIRVVVNYS